MLLTVLGAAPRGLPRALPARLARRAARLRPDARAAARDRPGAGAGRHGRLRRAARRSRSSTETEEIDAVRYPNFARLAATPPGIRNATTVHEWTSAAVPSILTGRFPEDDELPALPRPPRQPLHAPGRRATCSASSNRRRTSAPRSSVRSAGSPSPSGSARCSPTCRSFPATSSCPRTSPRGCRASPAPGATSGALTSRASACRRARPRRAGASRPTPSAISRWPRSCARSGPRGSPRCPSSTSSSPTIPGSTCPTAGATPSTCPRSPAWWTSAGSATPTSRSRRSSATCSRSATSTRSSAQILDRLEKTGVYDDALVVFVADHGVSFRPHGERRRVNEGNLEEIAFMPLFIKAPGQRERPHRGRPRAHDRRPADDRRPARGPHPVEDRTESPPSASPRRPPAGDRAQVERRARRRGTRTSSSSAGAASSSARYACSGTATTRPGLFAIGPHPELVGREVGGLASAAPPAQRSTSTAAPGTTPTRLSFRRASPASSTAWTAARTSRSP